MIHGGVGRICMCVLLCCLLSQILQRAALHSEDTTLFGLSLKELVPERFSRTHDCPQVSLGHCALQCLCVHGGYLEHMEQVYNVMCMCVHCTVYVCAFACERTDHTLSPSLYIQIL